MLGGFYDFGILLGVLKFWVRENSQKKTQVHFQHFRGFFLRSEEYFTITLFMALKADIICSHRQLESVSFVFRVSKSYINLVNSPSTI